MRRWLRLSSATALLPAALAVLSAQESPQSSPPRTGAISGVVTDGAGGLPVDNAQVLLTFDRPGAAAPIRRTQITDPLGRFVFTGLDAADSFRLTASRAGFSDGAYGQATAASTASAALALSAGQWLSNVRIPIWRHASLSGQVSNERGEPLAGVFVRALMRVRAAGLNHVAAGPIVKADDRGRYRIAGLRPGTYFVYVPIVPVSVPSTIAAAALSPRSSSRVMTSGDLPGGTAAAAAALPTVSLTETTLSVLGDYPLPPRAADGKPLAYPITFAGGATSFDHAQPIEVGGGTDRDGLDIRLLPVPASIVRGVVETQDRRALPTSIRLLAPGLEGLGLGGEAAIAMPDADGSFVFGPVPLGVYTLDVSAQITEYTTGSSISQVSVPRLPGVAALGREVTFAAAPGGPPRMMALDPGMSASVPVVVGDAGAPPVIVRLQPPPLIRGEIKLELDAAHPFEPEVTRYITLDEATGRPQFVRILPQRTEPHEFAYTVLPAAYWLRSSSATLVVKSVTCDGRDCTHQPIDVSDGRDAPDVVVTVTNAAPRLSGTVRDRSGATTPATVMAFPADPNQWTHYGLVPAKFRVAPVGASGVYQLSRLPAGDYFVLAVPATHTESWRDPDFLRRAVAYASRLSLGWGDVRSQDLVLADIH